MAGQAIAFEHYRSGEFQLAEDEARTALAQGEHAGLRHLLGVLLCRRGRVDEGAAEFARALELAPAHPAIRISYVRSLIDLGRGDEALRHARRPAPGPAAVDFWRLRADAAEAAGDLADRAEALHNADLEASLSELEIRPGDIELKLHCGRLLGALARNDEAERIYREVLIADAANVEAVHELGLILERSNLVDEVRALIDRAVAAGANGSKFALLEAILSWRGASPRDTLHWLAKADVAREPVRTKQLEAKAHDALGNSEAAFEAAQAKNRAVGDYAQWRQRSAAFRGELHEFSKLITPQITAKWSPSAPDADRTPVFLVGFPRSGTTLLDTFLMGHPGVAVIEEVPTIGLLAEQIGSAARILDLDHDRVAQLRTFYLERMARLVPDNWAGLVVDKLPLNVLNAPLIHRLFPEAPIIFARRHPCDCVLSGFFQSFAMNPAMACFLDICDAAELYDVAMKVWTRSESALPLNVHSIAYERMVERPEQELRQVIAFLGLDWDPRLLDHRRTARDRGAIITPSYEQVTGPISTRSVERWRRYEAQLEPALPLLLPWAARLGYCE